MIKFPWYRCEGKIETPITEAEFKEGMQQGHFVKDSHRAYAVLLYYSAVRKEEARRAIKEQFRILPDRLMFDVGKRLKHGKHTPPLPIPLDAPFVFELVDLIRDTHRGDKVFKFCHATAYNIVRRVFKYPHWFRLSRITWFFQQGFTIAEVRSWTGLSLKALDYYVGIVGIDKMGRVLK